MFLLFPVIAISALFTSQNGDSVSPGAASAGCSATLLEQPAKLERTVALIKPDAVQNKHIGEIIASLEKDGFRIVAMKMVQLSDEQARSFYSVHSSRPFYNDLVQFMTAGPIVAIVLEGEDAVAHYRALMGATDPAKAQEGTLRARFAASLQANAVHGSDSAENAEREINLLFNAPQER